MGGLLLGEDVREEKGRAGAGKGIGARATQARREGQAAENFISLIASELETVPPIRRVA
jgi:hypothetical protein